MVAAANKRIVVFADGTGNAFTTQESNVWRLHQALDQSCPDQIALYIKGVGTSGFRPFALIDGATGIGVPSNVRTLYEFICWNWQQGDEIYMFGFSRGAFTIRTLIGLIHHEGLVPTAIGEPLSKAEMRRNVVAAWRSYRKKTTPWNKCLPTIGLARMVRDAFTATYHALLRHRSYKVVAQQTEIQRRDSVRTKFVGLFDTVEAFGVPIEEFRRAIDYVIWPISFRNHVLSNKVDRACHALSLDDERTTFHPLRFDMTNENTANPRIKEVWFAGVHSDVGGGYPENELEHVPLVWMAEQAMAPTQNEQGGIEGDLRFINSAIDKFRSVASPFAACHDSRAGLSVFYRYGPRQIGSGPAEGGAPVIHHSVAEKMVFGSERYAPKVLPSTAWVLMPNNTTHKIKGFDTTRLAAAGAATLAGRQPVMDQAIAAIRALRDTDAYVVSLVHDLIWWRRVAYFALLFATILLASLPLTAEPLTNIVHGIGTEAAGSVGINSTWAGIWGGLASIAGGITAFLGSIFALIGSFIPAYAKPWANISLKWPITCGVVAAIVLALYWLNGALRDRIVDLARQAWFPLVREQKLRNVIQMSHGAPPFKNTFAHFMRTSRPVKLFQLTFSDYVFPALGLILIFAVVAVSISRSSVSYYEGHGDVCQGSKHPQTLGAGETVVIGDYFSIDSLCWASGEVLQQGRSYTLWIEMVEPFFDRTIMTDIAGYRDKSFRHLMGLPIRRWWSADWFQPIIRIGETDDVQSPLDSIVGDAALDVGTDANGKRIPINFYDDTDYAGRLRQILGSELDPTRFGSMLPYKIPDSERAAANGIREKYKDLRKIYVSQFVAKADGEMFLYLNDAIAAIPLLGVIGTFYENNTGLAKITIKRAAAPM